MTEGGTIAGDTWHASVDDGRVVDVAFVRDGGRVFVATSEGTLRHFDAETGTVEASHSTALDLRWARPTRDASLVTVGGDPARTIAPGW